MGFLKSIIRDVNKEFDKMKDFGPFSYGDVNCYVHCACSTCRKNVIYFCPNDWVIGDRSINTKCRECRDKDEYENNYKKSISYNLYYKNPWGEIAKELRGNYDTPQRRKKRRLLFVAFNNLASKNSLNWFDLFLVFRNSFTWISTGTSDEKIIEDIKYSSPHIRDLEDRYELMQKFYEEGVKGNCPECSTALSQKFKDEDKEKYPEWFCDEEDKCWHCRFPKKNNWHHHANLEDDIAKIAILTEKLKEQRIVFNTT